MSIPGIFAIGTVLLLAGIPLVSCSGKPPANLGVTDSELAPCPASPNCLSSDAHDSDHKTPPFQLDGMPSEVWAVAREVVAELPRARIVDETPEYLHAECRSSVFGFVDDLELHLRPSDGIIAVRSASRLGYSDFGVNQRRIEGLRTALSNRGMIR
ncbi:MAG: DUF1499 domain-containing protein [Desulfuromusa sp.]|nr:DUF1499 domain-containing protein [Desulfuromusa sp.]